MKSWPFSKTFNSKIVVETCLHFGRSIVTLIDSVDVYLFLIIIRTFLLYLWVFAKISQTLMFRTNDNSDQILRGQIFIFSGIERGTNNVRDLYSYNRRCFSHLTHRAAQYPRSLHEIIGLSPPQTSQGSPIIGWQDFYCSASYNSS